MNTLVVPRMWPNATVVCLATGPSLTEADCAFVRGRARVIAINDAHRLAPWADVLYSSDRHWYPHYKGVPEFKGMKYGISLLKGAPVGFDKYPDIAVLRNLGRDGLSDDPSGLTTGRNSGFAAIGVAVHAGASRVLLLGYDMQCSSAKAHFFGSHPKGLNQTTESMFSLFRSSFETLIEPLRARGVEVINCSRESALACFPRMTLEEALRIEVAA